MFCIDFIYVEFVLNNLLQGSLDYIGFILILYLEQ